jgi:hypothetical protein
MPVEEPGGVMALFQTAPEPEEIKAAQPMVDWVNSASPGDVAAELMGAFQVSRLANDPELTMVELTKWMLRIATQWVTYYPVRQALREAIQLLEHSELVLYTPGLGIENSYSAWTPTRLGLATLAEGKPAVRQRIRDRTGC